MFLDGCDLQFVMAMCQTQADPANPGPKVEDPSAGGRNGRGK